jgi:hypothetical protein
MDEPATTVNCGEELLMGGPVLQAPGGPPILDGSGCLVLYYIAFMTRPVFFNLTIYYNHVTKYNQYSTLPAALALVPLAKIALK